MNHQPARSFRLTMRLSVLTTALCIVATTASAGDTLSGGIRLEMGQWITSAQGKYSLAMQTDGNLVMYRSDGTVRYRMSQHGWFAVMQDDGNFVEYNGIMAPIFDTGTWNNPGAALRIQDDGNLVVYSKSLTPLWNIGAEPEAKDPKLPADVVGRDLDVAVGGFLGHVGLFDGATSVLEADNGFSNAIRIVTLNQFKSTTHNYWGAASPNIPSGLTSLGCYQLYCITSNNYQQFDMRIAIARAAYAANLVGASYTITGQWTIPKWGNAYYPPTRGVFRCDTFVLWALGAPPYYQTTPEHSRWKTFIQTGVFAIGTTPTIAFNALKSYQ